MESLHTERVTTEILKNGAQELLEDYYEERDRLVGEITTFQEALDNAKEGLRKLNKKNKNLLIRTGAYKSLDHKVFDFIAKNQGLLSGDLRILTKDNPDLCYMSSDHSIAGIISNLLDRGLLKREDGRYYTVGEFRIISSDGAFDFIREFLKTKSATKEDIKKFAKSRNRYLNGITINNSLNYFIAQRKVTSSQTYRGQRNVVYTWIGERE